MIRGSTVFHAHSCMPVDLQSQSSHLISSHLNKHVSMSLRGFISRVTDGCRHIHRRAASTSRAWGTLSLLRVLLQARIPKRDIILIATVGCICVLLDPGGRLLGRTLLLATVRARIHFGEVRIVVVWLIIDATVPTARAAVLFLL